jgi:flagellar protein FlgJ
MADYSTVLRGQAGAATLDTSRLETRANLDAAAGEFEAIFTGMMLKSMRGASLGEGILDSAAGATFRDRLDAEVSTTLGKRGAMGIGATLARFLAQSRPKLQPQQPLPATERKLP